MAAPVPARSNERAVRDARSRIMWNLRARARRAAHVSPSLARRPWLYAIVWRRRSGGNGRARLRAPPCAVTWSDVALLGLLVPLGPQPDCPAAGIAAEEQPAAALGAPGQVIERRSAH